MKQLILTFGLACLVACGGGDGNGPEQAGSAPAEKAAIAQQTCPVMEGNPINPKLYVERDGKRVYVCCQACLAKVKQDFDTYYRKVQEQLGKDGGKATEDDGKAMDDHAGHDH